MPNSTSLLLQQLSRKRGKENLLFACVCEEEREKVGEKAGKAVQWNCQPGTSSGYMTERLHVWFYEKALVHCRNRGTGGFSVLGEGLKQAILQTDRELGGVDMPVCGLICIESDFLFFYRGRSELYLLNSRFERANLRRLSDKAETLALQYGTIQKGAGILLATHDFCQRLGEQPLRECLAVREICVQEQADKRLGELSREAERRNAKNAGAVLVLTV